MPGFMLCAVNNLKIPAKIQYNPDSMGICRWQDKIRSLHKSERYLFNQILEEIN